MVHLEYYCAPLANTKLNKDKILDLSWLCVHLYLLMTLNDDAWITETLNPMRTTSRLVKMNIFSFIEPIREGVRKNSLICNFGCYILKALSWLA